MAHQLSAANDHTENNHKCEQALHCALIISLWRQLLVEKTTKYTCYYILRRSRWCVS